MSWKPLSPKVKNNKIMKNLTLDFFFLLLYPHTDAVSSSHHNNVAPSSLELWGQNLDALFGWLAQEHPLLLVQQGTVVFTNPSSGSRAMGLMAVVPVHQQPCFYLPALMRFLVLIECSHALVPTHVLSIHLVKMAFFLSSANCRWRTVCFVADRPLQSSLLFLTFLAWQFKEME